MVNLPELIVWKCPQCGITWEIKSTVASEAICPGCLREGVMIVVGGINE